MEGTTSGAARSGREEEAEPSGAAVAKSKKEAEPGARLQLGG